MTTTQLTTVGDALGIVLPAKTVEKLRVALGDQLTIIDTPNGVEITALSQEAARQLEVGRQIIAENREALTELAK
jgi:bifunctional DNA-binding transcriptional regulator/antitoxin component of YhaV-PrlF toxin-antitoxin module